VSRLTDRPTAGGRPGGLPPGRAALARIRFCARHPAATSRPSLTVAPHNRHQRAGSDRAIRDSSDRIWHTPAVPRRLTQFDPDLP